RPPSSRETCSRETAEGEDCMPQGLFRHWPGRASVDPGFESNRSVTADFISAPRGFARGAVPSPATRERVPQADEGLLIFAFESRWVGLRRDDVWWIAASESEGDSRQAAPRFPNPESLPTA